MASVLVDRWDETVKNLRDPPDANKGWKKKSLVHPRTFHPSFRPLYVHFATTVTDVIFPFTRDVDEVIYVAAAVWPGFVWPLLGLGGEEEEEEWTEPQLPSEATRMGMTKQLTSTVTSAFETLHTRQCSAEEWVRRGGFDYPRSRVRERETAPDTQGEGEEKEKVPLLVSSLSLIAKYILLASFIASTNPVKSDIRLFGRGLDGGKGKGKGKRRGGGGGGARGGRGRGRGGKGTTGKGSESGGGIKIPQRLLGPLTFPLDRMLAILGALMEEHDAASRFREGDRELYTIPGEWVDNMISRSGVLSCVSSLSSILCGLRKANWVLYR